MRTYACHERRSERESTDTPALSRRPQSGLNWDGFLDRRVHLNPGRRLFVIGYATRLITRRLRRLRRRRGRLRLRRLGIGRRFGSRCRFGHCRCVRVSRRRCVRRRVGTGWWFSGRRRVGTGWWFSGRRRVGVSRRRRRGGPLVRRVRFVTSASTACISVVVVFGSRRSVVAVVGRRRVGFRPRRRLRVSIALRRGRLCDRLCRFLGSDLGHGCRRAAGCRLRRRGLRPAITTRVVRVLGIARVIADEDEANTSTSERDPRPEDLSSR